METVLATFGGILILLGMGLGALSQTILFHSGQRPPVGDRIAAVVVGVGLVGLAVVLKIDGPTVSLVSTFGVVSVLILLYSLYLLVIHLRS